MPAPVVLLCCCLSVCFLPLVPPQNHTQKDSSQLTLTAPSRGLFSYHSLLRQAVDGATRQSPPERGEEDRREVGSTRQHLNSSVPGWWQLRSVGRWRSGEGREGGGERQRSTITRCWEKGRRYETRATTTTPPVR